MNHRYVWTALTLALAAVVMVAIGASQAHADSKIYSGLMCVNYGSAGIANYEYGAIGNYSSTDTLRVGCPIVRDGNNTTMTGGYVQVFNRPGSPRVACRIVAGSATDAGLTGAFSSYQYSTNDGEDWLSFGNPGGTPFSHYYYFCTIPPMTSAGASHVVSYQVIEHDENAIE
jgi:hypothetical protein